MRRLCLQLLLASATAVGSGCGVSSAPSHGASVSLSLDGYHATVEIAAGVRHDRRRTSSQYVRTVDSEGGELRTVLMNFGAIDGREIVLRDGTLTVGALDYGEVPSGGHVAIDAAGAVRVNGSARTGRPRFAQPAGPSAD